MDREAFKKWYESDGYIYVPESQAWTAWQACANHYEAERNALLAVIEQKNASIKLAIDMFAVNGLDLPNTVETLKDDLALTPENVKLVEVGEVETIGGYPDTSQQLCYLKKYAADGTKLYTIEVQP